MEKSEMYKIAQIAMLESRFDSKTKLAVIHELMDKEALAKWAEEKEAKENA